MTEKLPKDKLIATQYAELNKCCQSENFDRAVKAANKILEVAPNEFLAFKCKVVCLIHLARFDEALSQINKNPEYFNDLIFEKAYCLYRLNRHTEALDIVKKCPDESDYRVKELKAQILYRLEQYREAHNVYQDIIKNTDDEYEDERLTNLYATLASSDECDKIDLDDIKETPYELCYNKACILISSENYVEAEKKLKQAEQLCREKLQEDEDITEEDIELELALIKVQLAYVYQKQGRLKEAHLLYSSALKLKLEDIALQAVASNNVVCINKDQNLFDSKKKMKVALNETLLHKLPLLQRKFIALNNAIFNFYVNQPEQCEKACKVVETTWPELTTTVNILRALNFVRESKLPEAVAVLKNNKNDSSDLYVNLCLAQFHLMNGDKRSACKVLENLGQDSYRAGIVGALTTLYMALGDEQVALKLFERSVEFYKKQKNKSIDLSRFWKQAAEFHIENGHPQVAANSLEELLSANKDDKKIGAQLVLAYSKFDKARALEVSKELPDIKELSEGVDIDSIQILSAVNLKKSPNVNGDSQPSTPKSDGTIQKKTRKHKKRKGKLPKNYDASSKPDPERWLPKYERTGYRKKRRTKDVIKGSQGTSYGHSEQFDFSKKVEVPTGSPNVEPSPKLQQPNKQSQHQKKANQKKKNKRR